MEGGDEMKSLLWIHQGVKDGWRKDSPIWKSGWLFFVSQLLVLVPLITYLFFHLLYLSNSIRVPNRPLRALFDSSWAVVLVIGLLYVFWLFGVIAYSLVSLSYQMPYEKALLRVKQRFGALIVAYTLLFVPLFLLFVPLVARVVHPVIREVLSIPSAIAQLLNQPLGITLWVIVFLWVSYVAYLSLEVFDRLLAQNIRIKEAFVQSRQSMKKRGIRFFFQLFSFLFLLLAIFSIASIVAYVPLEVAERLFSRRLIVFAGFSTAFLQLMIISINFFFPFMFYRALQKQPVHLLASQPSSLRYLFIWGSVFIVIVTLGNSFIFKETIYQPTTQIIAHRGYSNAALENTTDALKEAAKRGADYVELDIQETKDGQFIVYHDKTLKRLGKEKKAIHSMTFDELVGYPIQDDKFQGEIPSFEQFVKVAKEENIRLLIELKIHGHESENYLEKYRNLLYTYGIAHSSITQSMDLEKMEELRALDATLETSDLMSEELEELPETEATYLSLKHVSVDQSLIDQSFDRRKRIFVWTIEKEEKIDELVTDEVAGIITNHVNRALDVRSYHEERRTFFDRLRYIGKNAIKM